MTNHEVIRRAFWESGEFQDDPEEISGWIELWVQAIVQGTRRGYDQMLIVDGEHADMFSEEGKLVLPHDRGQDDGIALSGDAQNMSDAELREFAFRVLEGAARKGVLADPGADLLWLRYNEESGEWTGVFGIEVLVSESIQ